MDFESAIRLTEILLAIAFIQQSIEHLSASYEECALFVPRLVFSILLLTALETKWVCIGLLIHGILILRRFQGSYNGGSDRMTLLILSCLSLIYFLPTLGLQELVFGYLAMQLIASYFIAGIVKAINLEWRSGRALQDLFRFSIYPASESLRSWADRPKMLCLMSWTTIVFELVFPLSLITQETLMIGLMIAASFHLANAFVFGFNRFFWAWIAAYPSVIWLQHWIFA